MKILNFGSLNIDHVYNVPHFVRPGETLNSDVYQKFPGGKGFNQSVALARAGVKVFHAGKIGADGEELIRFLKASGADTSLIDTSEYPTGHAIIQVIPKGENSIILHGGANQDIHIDYINSVLAHFDAGDVLLIQNEINTMSDLIRLADLKKMKIIFNPAPMTPKVNNYPLDRVDIFILNEVEGKELMGEEQPDDILKSMMKRYPVSKIILTLGKEGVRYLDGTQSLSLGSQNVHAIDTTAAGDTFIGYVLAGMVQGLSISKSLELATEAAAICVTRRGAAPSIPKRDELQSGASHQ